MTALFYWTGVMVWGLLVGGSIIIIVLLVGTHVANNIHRARQRAAARRDTEEAE